MRKLSLVLLAVLIAAALFTGCAKKQETAETVAVAQTVKNPDTFIYASHGTLDSLDPAKAYDNASGGVIQNIYETLITYDGEATDKFIPVLAEVVPTVENGGISADGKVYRFKIRKGVKFHNGNDLTPEDVRYSIIRGMVTECDGGPFQALFYPPFFGVYSAKDENDNFVVSWEDFDKAVRVDGDYVVFTLKNTFPGFLAMLAGYWGSIIDKEWSIQQGAWDGTPNWQKFNRPAEGQEALYEVANGTGPFKLDRWEKAVELVMSRNENYWGPKPAMAKVIYRMVEEWATRKLMLLQGDVDVVEVDPMYYSEMDAESGLTVYRSLKELGVRGINFNFKIDATDNPLIGSGKLDGKGIPPDFFNDVNVRKAFVHAWNEDVYINDILAGAGAPVATPIVDGLPFYNPDLKYPAFDLKLAEEYFKKAFNGKLWEVGFEFDGTYNAGNDTRMASVRMLSENLARINPKFKMNVRAVEWAEFLDLQRLKRLPLFYIGWGADYPDPDNFVVPYMHSQGLYGGRSTYKNPEVDKLVEEGAVTLDPNRRKEIYYRLQELWIEDAPGIIMHQPIGNRYFKDWVKGYQFHPMENPYNYKMFTKGYQD